MQIPAKKSSASLCYNAVDTKLPGIIRNNRDNIGFHAELIS